MYLGKIIEVRSKVMDAFTSLEELYNRLLPALKNKRREMKREKMQVVKSVGKAE